MNYLNIDYLIVYAFLAITLIIGLRAGRGIKDIREYAIANKTFGTGALVLTLLATNIAGASVIHGTTRIFSEGIIMTVALLGVSISFLIAGLFIAPKAAHFNNCLTMGDLMGNFYGFYSGIIAGGLSLINAILLVGMELHVLGIICESLLGIQAKWGIIVGGLVLAAYSAHGGIKAVTTTDILQFIMLAIFIPLIAYKAVGQIGGIKQVIQQTPLEKFKVFSHKDFSFYFTLFLMWIIPAGMVDPAIIQRLLMAKTSNQLRNQYLVVATFDPVFQLLLLLISLCAIVLYPHLEAQQVIPHLIHNLLPTGVQGLAIVGVLSVGMSTIDSYLHAAGLTAVHDIIAPIYKQKSKLIDEVKWAQFFTLLIGIVGIYIALKAVDILGLAFSALEVTSPLLMFPLFAGIMGLKTSKQEFYIAMGLTLVSFLVCKILLPSNLAHLNILFSTATNGICFFVSHFIKNNGFATINRPEETEKIWKPHRKEFVNILKSMLPRPKRIVAYSQEKVARYGAPYILFGIFCVINYTVPYFIWTDTPPEHENLLIYLRVIGGILCVLLIVKEKWSSSLLPYFPIFWHLTVLYCLPFNNTVMFLATNFNIEWLMSILGIIVLLLVILDWATAIIIGVLGVVLGLVFYKLVAGPLAAPISFDAKYLMVYESLFGIIIGLIFARRKQLAFNRVTTQRDYLKHTQQDINTRLVETFNYREELLRELDNQEIIHLDEVTANYIKQSIYRITDYLRLHVTTISINDFLEKVSKIPQLQESVSQPELYIQNFSRVKEIQADEDKLYEVLVNSIGYLQSLNSAGKPIKLALEDTLIGHSIAHIKDYTRKLNALKITITTEENLPAKQDIYTIDTSKPSTWLHHEHTIKEATLVENAQIVDAHYGYMDIQSTHTHTYVIPVKLREIRGKVMELLREPAAADPDELKHPTAIQLEKELWDKLKGTNIDRTVIEKALATIKKYHGGVKRRSGEPFFTHPINVALILLDQIQDQDATLGALLHDTVEDTSLTLTQIQGLFGETVAFIVGKVTNLEDNLRRISLDDHENLQRLMNYEDERVALVKLSDRLHNMRTIQFHPSLSKQKNIANETLAFFVPMAKQLGKMAMANELESLSLEVMSKKEIN